MVIRCPQLHHLLKAIDHQMFYQTFQSRRYLSRVLLGLIFVLGVAWMASADRDIFPSRYDWILGCLLFVTTLAWMGAAALAGVVAPVGNTAMKYAYRVLLAFPLAVVASLVAFRIMTLFFNTEHYWLYPLNAPFVIALCLWMVLTGLVGALAPHEIDLRPYILLVIAPLLMGIGFVGFLLLILAYELLPSVARLPEGLVGSALLGSYGLAVFLLFRDYLPRLAWTHRLLRSNLLFVPVVVSTIVLTILNLGLFLLLHRREDAAVIGLVIFVTFGVVTLGMRSVRVEVTALGIAMASYPVAIMAAVAGGVLLVGPGVPMLHALPLVGAMFLSAPVGILISTMRHPYRNLLVATIGPGLVMIMIIGYFWFGIVGTRT